jgi:hypothetical protein
LDGDLRKGLKKSMSYANICIRALVLCMLTMKVAQAEELCFKEAGQRYNISPILLEAIAFQESGLDPLALNAANRNGTFDIGIMQINSSWFDELEAFGIRAENLWQPCLNIHVGAWILAQEIERFGYTWQAVGAYNAKDLVKQNVYVEKIINNLKRFTHQ